jgi:hypothetical protein
MSYLQIISNKPSLKHPSKQYKKEGCDKNDVKNGCIQPMTHTFL